MSNFPPIRKPPATLRVHQGKVAVRLLHHGFIRESIEEPLTRLVKSISDLLGNLRMQRLKTLCSSFSGLRRVVAARFHSYCAYFFHTLLFQRVSVVQFTRYFKLGFQHPRGYFRRVRSEPVCSYTHYQVFSRLVFIPLESPPLEGARFWKVYDTSSLLPSKQGYRMFNPLF